MSIKKRSKVVENFNDPAVCFINWVAHTCSFSVWSSVRRPFHEEIFNEISCHTFSIILHIQTSSIFVKTHEILLNNAPVFDLWKFKYVRLFCILERRLRVYAELQGGRLWPQPHWRQSLDHVRPGLESSQRRPGDGTRLARRTKEAVLHLQTHLSESGICAPWTNMAWTCFRIT